MAANPLMAWMADAATVGHTVHVSWVGVALMALLVGGVVCALPFWFGNDSSIGNVIGAFAISVGVLALIVHEYAGLKHFREACTARGVGCHTHVSDFSRYAIYIGVGFADIFVVFMLGLLVEERLRARRRRRLQRVTTTP